MKKIFIVLGIVVLVLIVLVLVGTKGAVFNNGVPLTGINFTAGDIENFSPYPGATQSTDSGGIVVPDDMRRVNNQDIWKRYITNGSRDEVIKFYDDYFFKIGAHRGQPRESGLVIYTTGDTRYLIYLAEVEGKTNIILGLGKE